MFHLHFHFEESYAAWIQVIVSIVGIYFVYKAFQQGNDNIRIANHNTAISNENHRLQITGLRNSIRPHLRLEYFGQDAVVDNTVRFKLFVENKDAIDFKMSSYDTHYILRHIFLSDEQTGAIIHGRIVAGSKLLIHYELKPFPSEDYLPPRFINMVITYKDDMGYGYSQNLTAMTMHHELTLSEVNFL